MDPIKYESVIKIENVPIQWIPKFELYYPDLPQFPIIYIHFLIDNKRIYGFPVFASFSIRDINNCNVEILFLCNENLDTDLNLKEAVKNELEERFGVSEKINIQDIISCCNGIKEYEDFFKELWKYISKIYGDFIPYGKFFEEIFSIIRFVSAWQPKTGRQSEMRMLYNFLSIFGEKIEISGKWDYLEYYLLPTYEEVKLEKFDDFKLFKNLFAGMQKIWDNCFTKELTLNDMKIKSLKKAWPKKKNGFIEEVTYPLYKKKILSLNERHNIERLVDAFNRYSWRAAFFISSIMNIKEKDYKTWDKDFFIKFYLNKNGVGISEKVFACFLQQGFKNSEAIPIDTWVESFYQHVLAIKTPQLFFNTFSNMGKLERAIWLSSQANKTNIKMFFNLLWCTRFGDTGNNELRGPNPISCYECKLRDVCPSYSKIKNKKVILKDKSDISVCDLLTKKGNFKGKIIESNTLIIEANMNGIYYVCITEDKVPKKIFKKIGENWKLIDEFSGYLLTNQKIRENDVIITVDELVNQMPPYFK